jgi:hypothetical protein
VPEAGVFGAGHGGTLTIEYMLLTGAVPPAAAGGANGLASAADGISGEAASAVTTALLTSALVHAGTARLPAAVGYTRAWLCAAAFAAAGAVPTATFARAIRPRHRYT